MVTAEVRGGTQWETRWEIISAKEALRLNPLTLMRCPECHGRVRVQLGGLRGACFAHLLRHDGCSLVSTFSGTRERHPKPVE